MPHEVLGLEKVTEPGFEIGFTYSNGKITWVMREVQPADPARAKWEDIGVGSQPSLVRQSTTDGKRYEITTQSLSRRWYTKEPKTLVDTMSGGLLWNSDAIYVSVEDPNKAFKHTTNGLTWMKRRRENTYTEVQNGPWYDPIQRLQKDIAEVQTETDGECRAVCDATPTCVSYRWDPPPYERDQKTYNCATFRGKATAFDLTNRDFITYNQNPPSEGDPQSNVRPDEEKRHMWVTDDSQGDKLKSVRKAPDNEALYQIRTEKTRITWYRKVEFPAESGFGEATATTATDTRVREIVRRYIFLSVDYIALNCTRRDTASEARRTELLRYITEDKFDMMKKYYGIPAVVINKRVGFFKNSELTIMDETEALGEGRKPESYADVLDRKGLCELSCPDGWVNVDDGGVKCDRSNRRIDNVGTSSCEDGPCDFKGFNADTRAAWAREKSVEWKYCRQMPLDAHGIGIRHDGDDGGKDDEGPTDGAPCWGKDFLANENCTKLLGKRNEYILNYCNGSDDPKIEPQGYRKARWADTDAKDICRPAYNKAQMDKLCAWARTENVHHIGRDGTGIEHFCGCEKPEGDYSDDDLEYFMSMSGTAEDGKTSGNAAQYDQYKLMGVDPRTKNVFDLAFQPSNEKDFVDTIQAQCWPSCKTFKKQWKHEGGEEDYGGYSSMLDENTKKDCSFSGCAQAFSASAGGDMTGNDVLLYCQQGGTVARPAPKEQGHAKDQEGAGDSTVAVVGITVAIGSLLLFVAAIYLSKRKGWIMS